MGQVAPTPPAKQPSSVGKITGKVVNDKGQPLPNARVLVRAVGSTPGAGQVTRTDQDGKFEVIGLDRVNYQIIAGFSAYAPVPRDPDSPPNLFRVGDSATIMLTKGGVITGTVTTQTGEPLVGIRVRARMVGDGDLQNSTNLQMRMEKITDDRGIYRLYGLPAGTYVVWAGGPGMNPGIDPFDTDVPTYAPSSTRDTAAEVTVRVGEETSNVDIRYRGELGHVVSGTISGPETNQEVGYGVDLTSAKDNGLAWSSTRGVAARTGGAFAIHGVDDGDYYVTARSYTSNQEWTISTSKRIRVSGADVTGIELVTQPLASVLGRVVLEETTATECTDKERPVFAETQISAWHRDTEATKEMPRFIWSLGAPATPDKEGNVTLKNVVPGQYRFVTQFVGKYWYLHSIALASSKTPATKPTDAMRTWTTIKAGDRLSGLTITLAQGAASLRGQMALGEGETLPDRLFVYLVPAEREKSDDVLRYFTSAVTPDGKIALNNVAPGRYWMLAQPAARDPLSQLTQIRMPDATELRARLRKDAEARKTEIEFKPCQNVVDFKLKL
jgi:hypothetical protein